MSDASAAVDLLAGMLCDGPATADDGTYRRPTLYNLTSDPGGAMIRERADQRVAFAFDESDGTHVSYEATVSQDDLFRALWSAGLLRRRVTRQA